MNDTFKMPECLNGSETEQMRDCSSLKENPFDKSYRNAQRMTAIVVVGSMIVWAILLCLDFDLWRILIGAMITVVVNISCLLTVRRLAKLKATFDEKIFDFDQKWKDAVLRKYIDYLQKQLDKKLADK